MLSTARARGLFLDDERNPEDVFWVEYPTGIDWTVVRCYDDFVSESSKGYSVISFDHDIQDFDDVGFERTGFTCAKHLVEIVLDKEVGMPVFYVHSKNVIGAANINKLLSNLTWRIKLDSLENQ